MWLRFGGIVGRWCLGCVGRTGRPGTQTLTMPFCALTYPTVGGAHPPLRNAQLVSMSVDAEVVDFVLAYNLTQVLARGTLYSGWESWVGDEID